MEDQHSVLHRLASAYGVLTEYTDIRGRRQQASPEALMEVLRVLGAEVKSLATAPEALERRQREIGQRTLDPVIVAWNGGPARLIIRHPLESPPLAVRFSLSLEDGASSSWDTDVLALPMTELIEAGSDRYAVRLALLPPGIPPGYHRLTIEGPRFGPATSMVISAPEQAFKAARAKRWGVFLPLYALKTGESVGAGDLGDLERLAAWTSGLGGSFVAVLPLLAAYLDKPLEISPYVPVSRLFWNEVYADLSRVADLEGCHAAGEALATARKQAADLGRLPEVDYRRGMALKRGVLEEAAACFFSRAEAGEQLRPFLAEHPHADEYARFRAAAERHGANWRAWPDGMRQGRLAEHDFSQKAYRYHLFAQWLMDRQMADAAAAVRTPDGGLYLDLPVGVHPDGFDTWRFRDAFAMGLSAGAPPDDFFTQGQDWGFPPFHPDRLRQEGYQYFISYIRHHLRRAAILRIDHVMAFQRVFCVPHGARATDGVYVQHHPDEFWAILCLESRRFQAEIIGENLGTVPPEVNAALTRHAIRGMYVGQFRVQPRSQELIVQPQENVAASLNTHDAPPFAAFWRGDDIALRLRLGYLTPAGEAEERANRERVKAAVVQRLVSAGFLREQSFEEKQVLAAWEAFLSAGPAQIMVVNLEDLWLESLPQNVPGTGPELPNWRRRAQHDFDAFSVMPEVLDVLRSVRDLRK